MLGGEFENCRSSVFSVGGFGKVFMQAWGVQLCSYFVGCEDYDFLCGSESELLVVNSVLKSWFQFALYRDLLMVREVWFLAVDHWFNYRLYPSGFSSVLFFL